MENDCGKESVGERVGNGVVCKKCKCMCETFMAKYLRETGCNQVAW